MKRNMPKSPITAANVDKMVAMAGNGCKGKTNRTTRRNKGSSRRGGMRKPSHMIICEIPLFFSKYIFSGGGGGVDGLIPHVLSCSFGPKQHPATRKTSLANFFRIGEAKWPKKKSPCNLDRTTLLENKSFDKTRSLHRLTQRKSTRVNSFFFCGNCKNKKKTGGERFSSCRVWGHELQNAEKYFRISHACQKWPALVRYPMGCRLRACLLMMVCDW